MESRPVYKWHLETRQRCIRSLDVWILNCVVDSKYFNEFYLNISKEDCKNLDVFLKVFNHIEQDLDTMGLASSFSFSIVFFLLTVSSPSPSLSRQSEQLNWWNVFRTYEEHRRWSFCVFVGCFCCWFVGWVVVVVVSL